MKVRRSVPVFLALACVFGVAMGSIKGDETGLRAGLGNLSAPWVVLPFLVATTQRSLAKGAAIGVAATFSALTGFYAAITAGALAGDLGGGGFAPELVREVSANRIYFFFGAVTAPLAGVVGARIGERRRRLVWLIVGATAALEIAVVAIARDRQLLPPPLYFSWAVRDWTPYVIEATIGVAVVAATGAQAAWSRLGRS